MMAEVKRHTDKMEKHELAHDQNAMIHKRLHLQSRLATITTTFSLSDEETGTDALLI
jgi:hypothetical protein